MHNLVANRLIYTRNKNLNKLPENNTSINKKNESPIISPEELKKQLLAEITPKPKMEILPDNKLEFISFANVFEFVTWYEEHRKDFTDIQQKPLDNLVGARNMAIGGCPCDRETRKIIAGDWFRKFWTNNKNTDLPPTLLKIANAKKVVFGNFLTYP